MTMGLIDHPTFGFEAPADPNKCVFHYTSLASAVAIAQSMTFRLSPMSRMNDPREFKLAEPMTVSMASGVSAADQAVLIRKIIERRLNIRAAAFTLDAADGKANSIPRADGRGYARPTMWAHYGDCHRGVCLVFNRVALEEALHRKFGADAFWERVRYPDYVDPADWSRYLILDEVRALGLDGAANRHFREYRSTLLFEKNVDWKGEREWRCCVDRQDRAGTATIDLTPAMVEGVVLGIDFAEADVPTVEPIAKAFDLDDVIAVAYLQQMNIIDVLPVNTDATPWRYCTDVELRSLGYFDIG